MILQGNSIRIPLADNSVHCVISSYPYYGLRMYDGLPPTVWGGDINCQHQWQTNVIRNSGGGERDYGSHDGMVGRGPSPKLPPYSICQLCGAFYGYFGLEPTIALHVQNAVLVSREVYRVLRSDGIFWLNYGDSYSTGRNGRSAADTKAVGRDDRTFRDKPFSIDELPAKNLCLIPQRIAIALQDDGWYVRSFFPWLKNNSMPESVRDRPSTAHEYMVMLTKGKRYYFDMEAVKKPGKEWVGQAGTFNRTNGKNTQLNIPGQSRPSHRERDDRVAPGRALRTSDFFYDSLESYLEYAQDIKDNGGLLFDSEGAPAALVVNTESYAAAHYATFPRKLIEPLVLCSTSARGVCPECGKPWERVTKSHKISDEKPSINNKAQSVEVFARGGNQANFGRAGDYQSITVGWQPTCKCPDNQPIPAVILDPFCGSGTVGYVANQLGRRFIGIDLSAEYLTKNALPRAERKTSQAAIDELPLFNQAA